MASGKLIKKFATLAEVIPAGEWRECAYCGKPLRPKTEDRICPSAYADGGRPVPVKVLTESVYTVIWKEPRPVPRAVLGLYYQALYQKPVHYCHVWTGEFEGYGWDGQGTLFHTQMCGVKFGAASYRAGMRMKKTS